MSSSASAQCSASVMCDCIVECVRCLERKRYTKNYYDMHKDDPEFKAKNRLNSKKQNEKKKRELDEARLTNASRDKIIAEAEARARQIIKNAEARARQIIKEAETQSEEIVAVSRARVEQIKRDNADLSNQMLANINRLHKLLE